MTKITLWEVISTAEFYSPAELGYLIFLHIKDDYANWWRLVFNWRATSIFTQIEKLKLKGLL